MTSQFLKENTKTPAKVSSTYAGWFNNFTI